jgi:hypothetical protein
MLDKRIDSFMVVFLCKESGCHGSFQPPVESGGLSTDIGFLDGAGASVWFVTATASSQKDANWFDWVRAKCRGSNPTQ